MNVDQFVDILCIIHYTLCIYILKLVDIFFSPLQDKRLLLFGLQFEWYLNCLNDSYCKCLSYYSNDRFCFSLSSCSIVADVVAVFLIFFL